MFTQKTSTEPMKKVQSMILQQTNIFRSGYIDSQLLSALSYFIQVIVMLLCSLHTCLLFLQNVDFTFGSFDQVHNIYVLALIC